MEILVTTSLQVDKKKLYGINQSSVVIQDGHWSERKKFRPSSSVDYNRRQIRRDAKKVVKESVVWKQTQDKGNETKKVTFISKTASCHKSIPIWYKWNVRHLCASHLKTQVTCHIRVIFTVAVTVPVTVTVTATLYSHGSGHRHSHNRQSQSRQQSG